MFFFFQAEDGIRDIGVTGVQTCALPIFRLRRPPARVRDRRRAGARRRPARRTRAGRRRRDLALDRRDVDGLRALVARLGVERDAGTLAQGTEALRVDARVMDEQVLAALI